MDMPKELELRLIHPDDQLSKLSLGSPDYTPLKIFLKKEALGFHQYSIAKTYVLAEVDCQPARIWGYVTLMSSEIILNEDQKPREISASAKYEAFPAIKIARLAVDKALQRKGQGRVIVQWCSSLVRRFIVPHVGCRFLVVDAKQESVSFYERMGFELLNTESNLADKNPLMFFDIYKNQ